MVSHVSPDLTLRPSAQREPVRLPLIQHYLREQQRLTAVERFSQRHDAHELPPGRQAYRDLIPLNRPGPGEQLAFEVDLDACTGCKACVAACHRLNGLDDEEGEVWRSVGLLHGGTPAEPVQQTVTTACHHCLDPACMKGCPVGAYVKDPVTGIVKHLDDQCIGCTYCTLTCPYEVPQYSKKRGIVRKCDLCSDRLAEGEAPACVQACPNEAIRVKIVSTARVLEDAQGDAFLPGAPSPGITVPTTTYKTKRALPRNLLPADFHRVRTSQRHTPLVVLLVLTQLSVGTFTVDFGLELLRGESALGARSYQSAMALALGLLALAASVFHLGRPAYAFRAILGIRTSWMSREVAAFGLFATSAMFYSALFFLEPLALALGMGPLPAAETLKKLQDPLGALVVSSGVLGVVCSVKLYQVTARRWWGGARTAARFTLTAAVLGLATALLAELAAGAVMGTLRDGSRVVSELGVPLLVAVLVKLAVDAEILLHLRHRRLDELKRTAVLLTSELRSEAAARAVMSLIGAAIVVLMLLAGPALGDGARMLLAGFAWLCLLGGELIERVLFFRALSAPRMPGGVGQ